MLDWTGEKLEVGRQFSMHHNSQMRSVEFQDKNDGYGIEKLTH